MGRIPLARRKPRDHGRPWVVGQMSKENHIKSRIRKKKGRNPEPAERKNHSRSDSSCPEMFELLFCWIVG